MRETWGVSFSVSKGFAAVATVLAVSCGAGERADEIKGLDGRLAKVEAALGAIPPASSSSEPSLSDLGQRLAKLEQESSTVVTATREPLTVDATGNEVCAKKNQVCVAVVNTMSSVIVDENQVPCGHMVADCNSRVSPRVHCLGDRNYVIGPIRFLRSPGMKGRCGDVGKDTCTREPSSFVAICLR